jgi:predicted dehydrogenase
MSNTKKIALIGAGYMASEYAKAIVDMPELELAGICSRTGDRAVQLAQKFNIPYVAENPSELYHKSKADAVIIAVPELSAFEVIAACLKFPWTLLIEKPPGYKPSVAHKLLEIVSGCNNDCFVALNRRFYGSTLKALSFLCDEKSQRTLIIQDQEDQISALKSGQPKEVVEAWMYANSIHIIDYAFMFCRGDLTNVNVIQPYQAFQPSVVQALMEFSSGDCATYVGFWQRPGPWAVQVSTENFRLELRPIEQLSLQKKGERITTHLEVDPDDTNYKPGLKKMCQNLVLALNKKPHKLPTLSEGVRLIDSISKIFDPQGLSRL